ncbi:hypothetical protein TGRH88_082420 [Toxoplasma gondii]|uniref:Uncharacterized protein n=1 Tax=Toxoplasma gondii TaxID=5811 RepID=A0A7J6K5U1_TOXGO|nr:hypothetical protein TGRH88_082420 [Toxoplasma gondii]
MMFSLLYTNCEGADTPRRKRVRVELSNEKRFHIARGGRRLVRSLSNKKSFYGSKPHDGLASWPSPESGYREFT